MTYYYCYIKNHEDNGGSDFEAQGKFPSKIEFANDIMTDYNMGEAGWTPESLVEHIQSEEEIKERINK